MLAGDQFWNGVHTHHLSSAILSDLSCGYPIPPEHVRLRVPARMVPRQDWNDHRTACHLWPGRHPKLVAHPSQIADLPERVFRAIRLRDAAFELEPKIVVA